MQGERSLVYVHTPELTMSTLKGCSGMVCHGVIIEDKVTFTPLVTQDNPAIIHELGKFLTQGLSFGSRHAKHIDDGRFTSLANALAFGPGFMETERVSPRFWVRCNEGQTKLLSTKCFVGDSEGPPVELAQLLK